MLINAGLSELVYTLFPIVQEPIEFDACAKKVPFENELPIHKTVIAKVINNVEIIELLYLFIFLFFIKINKPPQVTKLKLKCFNIHIYSTF